MMLTPNHVHADYSFWANPFYCAFPAAILNILAALITSSAENRTLTGIFLIGGIASMIYGAKQCIAATNEERALEILYQTYPRMR